MVAWLSRPARMCVRNPCRPLLLLGLTAVRKHPEPTAVDCQNSADCRPMGLPGEKEKDRCGGMNAAVFVELMVIETTTSSMRTKRSTN